MTTKSGVNCKSKSSHRVFCRSFYTVRLFPIQTSEALKQLHELYKNSTTNPKWDNLQSSLRCCGADTYSNYGNIFGVTSCVPASCCHNYDGEDSEVCTEKNSKVCPEQDMKDIKFYLEGCVDILKRMYRRKVDRVLFYYISGGTFLALMEIVVVALAFAYSAQIHRREKREREWAPGEDVTKGGQEDHAMADFRN